MKNQVLCLIWFVTGCSYAYAQHTVPEEELPVEYADVPIKPEFRGETWAFYISHNLKYPESALKDKIGGKVYVSFIIEKNGEISHVQVEQGLGYGLDEEALRIIKNSPRWKPGYRAKKQPVRVSCIMPISFNPAASTL